MIYHFHMIVLENIFKKLKIIDIQSKEHIKNILRLKNNKIEIDNDNNIISDNSSNIFVFGQEVDDFHSLDKNTIWTVSTAALQEVDRQLQARKKKKQRYYKHNTMNYYHDLYQ